MGKRGSGFKAPPWWTDLVREKMSERGAGVKLAEKIGINETMVSRLKGGNVTTIEGMQLLSRALGIPRCAFVPRDEDEANAIEVALLARKRRLGLQEDSDVTPAEYDPSLKTE